jgi:hypothetical protein
MYGVAWHFIFSFFIKSSSKFESTMADAFDVEAYLEQQVVKES